MNTTTKNAKKQSIGNNFVAVKSNVRTTKNSANSLLGALIDKHNVAKTENGAPTLKSSLNALVDLFAMGSALRNRSNDDVIKLFIKAFSEDALLATKLLFHIRNIRGGSGERKVFRTILHWMGDNYPDIVAKNMGNVALFGRYDDLFTLFNTRSENIALSFIRDQINKDVENYELNKSVSLLAKWLPSENTSSAQTRALGYKVRKYLGWQSKQYRKTLSVLRDYINVVEQKMSANEWGEIDYEAVPSNAGLNYRKAFYKHDNERYQAYVNAAKKGEVKVNASTLYPYDIIDKVRGGDMSETLDVLWNNLPDYFGEKRRNILCVCDVSLSMTFHGNTPMNTSIGLGIYTAEKNEGPFGGYFITYSSTPKLQKVVGNNIREKVKCLEKQRPTNTNLQAVFDLVLNSAVESNVSQEDMPEQILVISDMEFDSPQNGPKTNFQTIKEKYTKAGYEMPQLVFWNVDSRTNNIAAKANEKGVLLVSGQSPSVFKTLLSGKTHTPVDQMLETLNQKMYDSVTV